MLSSNTDKRKPVQKKILTKGVKKIMKISNSETNFIPKENVNPNEIKAKRSFTKDPDWDRVKEVDDKNPFDIPNHMRLFSKSTPFTKKNGREPFITHDVQTVCDIDENFYKVIEGRPVRPINDVKVYIRNLRNIALMRADAAFLKDEIIRIDTAFAEELEKFNKIHDLYVVTKKNFVTFAKQSYETAKVIQMVAAETANKLAVVTDELDAYSFEHVRLRNILSHTYYILKTLVKYSKFLFERSPLAWKKKHKILGVSFTESGTSISTTCDYINYVTDAEHHRPDMYFKKPEELMTIFDDIGRQCVNYMEINGNVANIFNPMQSYRNHLKIEVEKEVNHLASYVKAYEKKITYMEERADTYKEVFERILMSEFQELYASTNVSKLFTCVQYVHTQIFGGPEDPKDSVVTLMLRLEKLYIELTSGLDNLDQTHVKEATTQLYSEDIMMITRAHKAQRIMKESNILRKALYTSYDPPKVVTRPFKKRSK